MKTYAKGSRAERELIHFLNGRGFSVIRAASSGGFLTPADILAIKKGLVIAVECKAHERKPKLDKDKLRKLKAWCEQAGAIGLLGWRTTGKWLFLRLEDAEQGRYEDENWVDISKLLEAIDFR